MKILVVVAMVTSYLRTEQVASDTAGQNFTNNLHKMSSLYCCGQGFLFPTTIFAQKYIFY